MTLYEISRKPLIASKPTFIKSELLSILGVPHGVSLRVPGKKSLFSMKAEEVENRAEFFSALGFNERNVVRANQVHSSNVTVVHKSGTYRATDALITNHPDLLLTISIADCVPILIYDHSQKIVGAVHAGWRGTKERILMKALDVFIHEFNSKMKDVFLYIGPAASKCCYEVGEEVANYFDDRFLTENRNGRYMLDLKSVNSEEAMKIGVPAENIEVSEQCTICNLNFHSYRRDGENSGRMLAALGLKSFH
ncbi:MAG: peptidoglycan editing factor PgeF [Candidatus Kryptoniota bacterium]